MSGSLPSEAPLVVLAGLDEHLASATAAAFGDHGMATMAVERPRAETLVDGRRVTAVVLDASSGLFEALELCRRLVTERDGMPVVALAQNAVDTRIALLEAGADDCLSKPFAPRELVARVQTVQRRSCLDGNGGGAIEYADLRVDVAARRAWRGSREIELTRTEFALLVALAERSGHVVSRRDLLIEVWGYDFGPEFHSLGVYIGYLRRKLEEDGERRLIHTMRGVGYVLRDKGRPAPQRR